MSENEEIMNETENERPWLPRSRQSRPWRPKLPRLRLLTRFPAEEEAEVVEAAVDYDDEELMDKMQKAARLLRSRRFAISRRRRPRPSAWRTSSAPSSFLTSSPRWSRRKCPTCWACASVSSMA